VSTCRVHADGKTEQMDQFKLSGIEGCVSIACAGNGLLAAATSDQFLRYELIFLVFRNFPVFFTCCRLFYDFYFYFWNSELHCNVLTVHCLKSYSRLWEFYIRKKLKNQKFRSS